MQLDKDDYIVQLGRILQDVGQFIQPDDVENFLSQAVLVYSKDRPLEKIHELTGDGSSFDFAIPSDWYEGFSYIKGPMEYPADDTVQSENFLDASEWKFHKKLVAGVTTKFIRFLSFVPANTVKARFEYVTVHIINETEVTVKDGDAQALLSLAASLCYWALASRFAQHSDSTIEADVIDYSRKSEIYMDLAKEKMSMYRSIMGIGQEGKDSAPASVGVSVKEFDMAYPGSLGDFLTHPSLFR